MKKAIPVPTPPRTGSSNIHTYIDTTLLQWKTTFGNRFIDIDLPLRVLIDKLISGEARRYEYNSKQFCYMLHIPGRKYQQYLVSEELKPNDIKHIEKIVNYYKGSPLEI